MKKKKEFENWIAHVCWTKWNNMPWGERESRHWLKFFFVFLFSVAVLTYLFSSFISTAACQEWDPFSEISPKWGPQFLPVFRSLWLVFISRLYLVTSPNQMTFTTRCLLTFAWCRREEHVRSQWLQTCAKDLGPRLFCLLFLFTVVIHPWLRPESFRSAGRSVDTLSAFSNRYVFSFISPSSGFRPPFSFLLRLSIGRSIMLQSDFLIK